MTGPITGANLSLPYFNDYPIPAGPIGDPSKTYTVCFSQALFHPWATAQKESVMLEAARHPNLKVIYYNTDNDALQQVQDLNQCMNKGVNGILVWPNAVGPLTPVVNKIHAAGIPLVGMERTVSTTQYTSWVFLNFASELQALAQSICSHVGGTGKVAEELGTLGTSPEILRHGYFVQYMHQYCPKVTLVTTPATDFGTATGYSVGLTFLRSSASDGVKAIFTDATEEGQGLLKAEQQTGKSIPIWGIDADRAQIKLVENGQLAAVEDHTPLHGDLALRLLIMALEHKNVPPAVNINPPPLITPSNAAAAYAKGWGPAS
jgi:ribose transport system substrate-binding protein